MQRLVSWLLSFRVDEVKRFLFIFYLVGLIGFLMPFSHSLFLWLTRWALLFNVLLLVRFYGDGFTARHGLVYVVIMLAGFAVEMVGVNTGLVFGSYVYGPALGLKLWGTPLMIGLNWLMLTFCWSAVLQSFRIPIFVKVFLAALGMLFYDVLLEPSAPLLDMWVWHNDAIPLQNYVAWFGIALFFQALVHGMRMVRFHPLARVVLLSQMLFFFGLWIAQIIGLS
ncbi:putative membrane protein [Breznakibacter xylanolyticus]|uniref:Putative membrane protein n=1 Tax=Breznakibacter xylanolyticus TaxID=990 RepID=A0A2W7NE46_9BACT|nr:carotenoid biosynthesis protein [Breznakibacter xylanolyticus]PZX16377.1 putative membrane protein [Breznakibacter xylanolyticus]